MIASRDAVGNRWIISQFDEVLDKVRAGNSLSESLALVDGFEQSMSSSIAVGEETGKLDELLATISETLDFEAEVATKRLVTLLEPIMKVSVIVPDEYMGDVIGDLNSRRGQILGMEARPGAQQLDALVPLANMFGYATDLGSHTQGLGQYTMEPHSYAEIPKSIRDKIVEERGNKAEEFRSCFSPRDIVK